MRLSAKFGLNVFRTLGLTAVLVILLISVAPSFNHVSAAGLNDSLCNGGSCIFEHLTGDTSNITVVAQNHNRALSGWDTNLQHIPQLGNDVWGASQSTTGQALCPCQTLKNPKDPSAIYTVFVTRNGKQITPAFTTTTKFNFLNSPIDTINVPSGTTPVQNTMLKGTIDVQGSDGKTVAARTWSGARTASSVQLTGNGKTYDQATLGSGGTFTLSNMAPGTYSGAFDIQNPNDSTLDLQFTMPGIVVTAGTNNTIAVHVKLPQSGNGTYTANGTSADGKHYSVTGAGPFAATPSPAPNSGASVDDTATCEGSGNSLAWAICPIINGLASASDGIYANFVQPFLQTSTINLTGTGDPIFVAWTSFRNIADVILVIALLVGIFGQAISGGALDAYTIKKMMPRLLIAAVLINLSIYIVAGLLDIFNILGQGIGTLIQQPFKDSNSLTIHPGNTASGAVIGLGLVALVVAAFAIKKDPGEFLMFLFLLVLLPLLIAFLGVFGTLLIRQGIIIFLVIVSPIAFALYALPNTETYFKKWWELLMKTLLVYPIIVIIFALSRVLAGLLSQNNGSVARGALADIASMIILLIPLFLIPFAFRFAGGALGSFYSTLQGKTAGLHKMGFVGRRREIAKQNVADGMTTTRAQAYRRLNSAANKRGRFGKSALRFAANRAGGYNIMGAEAEVNARRGKMAEDQKATGDDTEQRALTVNKKWALGQMGALNKAVYDDNNNQIGWEDETGQVRTGMDRKTGRQFKTLGGRFVDETAVDAAHSRWGNDVATQQWALGYEMQKATTQEQQDNLRKNYGNVAQGAGGWGLTGEQGKGVWTGAAFNNQNINRQWKHYSYSGGSGGAGGDLKMNSLGMMQEIDERQGNYQMLQQNADTWTTMGQEVIKARRVLNGQETGNTSEAQEVLERAARIAYATRSASMAGPSLVPEGDDHAPIPAPGAGGARAGRDAGAGAPGRVQEEVNSFLAIADQYAGPYQGPPGALPGPNQAPVTSPTDAMDAQNTRGSNGRTS